MKMGYPLDLNSPKTFNEKLQWLKLYDRNLRYTNMVDKLTVKDFVAKTIGDEYVIPTLGVWNKPEAIEWDKLPNQFVLKTTQGGGNYGVIICKDKTSFDCQKAIKKLKYSLKQKLYLSNREWPYKNVVPRIIAEQFMVAKSDTNDLPDYKFFCFDGEVKALFVATDRQKPGEDVKFDFFDADYNHLPFKQGHEHAVITPPCPKSFEQMKTCAAKLSQGIPHVRVDMYEVDGRPYFGEMTFYHFAGWVPFDPKEWDVKFGEWLTLPNKN